MLTCIDLFSESLQELGVIRAVQAETFNNEELWLRLAVLLFERSFILLIDQIVKVIGGHYLFRSSLLTRFFLKFAILYVSFVNFLFNSSFFWLICLKPNDIHLRWLWHRSFILLLLLTWLITILKTWSLWFFLSSAVAHADLFQLKVLS